jgi:hypothetical protein
VQSELDKKRKEIKKKEQLKKKKDAKGSFFTILFFVMDSNDFLLSFVGGRIVCLKAQTFQTPSSSSFAAKAFMTSTTQQTLASVSSSSADVKH